MSRSVSVLLISIVVAALVALPGGGRLLTPERAYAASGATSLAPGNHTGDATPYNLTGPDNYDFESDDEEVGSPPSNYDFATGDFTDWTKSGTGVVESGGPSSSGYYAKLGNGSSGSGTLTSSAFTVDEAAQVMSLQRALLGTGGYNYLFVYVRSGPTYSTSTTVHTESCNCTKGWEQIVFDISRPIACSPSRTSWETSPAELSTLRVT